MDEGSKRKPRESGIEFEQMGRLWKITPLNKRTSAWLSKITKLDIDVGRTIVVSLDMADDFFMRALKGKLAPDCNMEQYKKGYTKAFKAIEVTTTKTRNIFTKSDRRLFEKPPDCQNQF